MNLIQFLFLVYFNPSSNEPTRTEVATTAARSTNLFRHQANIMRRQPVSTQFRPTARSFFQPSAELSESEFLAHGCQRVTRECSQVNRRPCNSTTVDESTCKRWKCCWDPTQSIPCAHSTFRIIKLNCGEEVDFSTCGIKPTNARRKRSIRFDPTTGRIIGGTDAEEGAWPWTAHIFEKTLAGGRSGTCGGVLIGRTWVLSVAHCFGAYNQPDLYGVTLGEHIISVLSGNEVFHDVKLIIRHPSFNSFRFLNDIALLELTEPVTYTANIRPICLVPPNTPTDSITSPTFADQKCPVVGWGLTTSPNGSPSDVLQELDVLIVPGMVCSETTLHNSLLYEGNIMLEGEAKFCAGGTNNEDSCSGDSGGPLACPHDDGRYYVHGLVSYGTSTCGQQNLFAIYTKVTDFSIWISSIIDN